MPVDIIIDGKSYEPEAGNVKELVLELNEYFSKKQAVMKTIVLNEDVTITTIEDLLDYDDSDVEKIKLESRSYEDLCLNTLKEVLVYLDKLDEGYESIVELVENDKISDAMVILNAAIEGIEWMNNAFSKIISILKIELTSEEDNFIKNYSGHLGELVSALQNQDYISVKDIILYDLKEDVAGWKKIIEKYSREGNKIQGEKN
ncbi:MAG: hypothetical protein C0601_03820 [Candidatus Muiribacterium halophilum]|uniref:DUF8042 domain-containing protein n=1 Tax=Muiribacterium halophilum TaxID=2053465 RepID=A0A2N5ZJH4_MUIH1|nr:MAG: hypothetical protein C0601_03820 [Candidatus Muirbacterium halophilum]